MKLLAVFVFVFAYQTVAAIHENETTLVLLQVVSDTLKFSIWK